MITQQHDHEIQQKAQAPSPVKLHGWVVALLSILGVALPLVAGWWVEWPLVNILPTEESTMTWLVAVFAGVAWFIGEILASVVHPLVLGGWSALPAYQQGFWAGEVGIIGLVVVPLLFSMAIGAAGGVALGKWRASRQ